MKKFSIALVLATLFFSVHAQVSFGPKAGINIPVVSFNNPNIKVDPIVINFYGGAFVDYKFEKQFAVKAELFYSGEGTKYKQIGNPTVFTDNFGYLAIPVLFQYVNNGGFYLETGPQLGFLLSATESFEGASEDIKSGLNSTKFSWCFGHQLVHGLGIGIRYSAGLSKLSKDENSDVKSSMVGIGLFYSFSAMRKTK